MGVHKKIKNPALLWQLFEQYTLGVKKKPRKRQVMNQRTGRMVSEKLEVPLTTEGFYTYVADQGFVETLKDYFSNREGRYEDFVPIVTRIRQTIRRDQIEGGMVGQYNHNLTARLNGLTDKLEHSGPDGGPIQMQQITGMEIK